MAAPSTSAAAKLPSPHLICLLRPTCAARSRFPPDTPSHSTWRPTSTISGKLISRTPRSYWRLSLPPPLRPSYTKAPSTTVYLHANISPERRNAMPSSIPARLSSAATTSTTSLQQLLSGVCHRMQASMPSSCRSRAVQIRRRISSHVCPTAADRHVLPHPHLHYPRLEASSSLSFIYRLHLRLPPTSPIGGRASGITDGRPPAPSAVSDQPAGNHGPPPVGHHLPPSPPFNVTQSHSAHPPPVDLESIHLRYVAGHASRAMTHRDLRHRHVTPHPSSSPTSPPLSLTATFDRSGGRHAPPLVGQFTHVKHLPAASPPRPTELELRRRLLPTFPPIWVGRVRPEDPSVSCPHHMVMM